MTETPHMPLEACPCCAHEAKFEKQMHAFPPKHWVKCTYCGMSSDAYSSRESARAAWNRRATSLPTTANNPETDAHRDLVEALRWIADNYENGMINHVDFRVEAKFRADAALTKAEVTHG